MRDIKRFYFDVETTGVNAFKNAIHQIAFIIEINGEIVAKEDWRIKPFPKAIIEDEALAVSGVNREQINGYRDHEQGLKDLKTLMANHVDKFNKTDKMHLVGFNNRYFDDRFLRNWFEICGDDYFGSWFWADSLDVMVLASQKLLSRRWSMKNFKLMTVAQEFGIGVDEDLAHDGLYDVGVTREIYIKITGSDLLS